MNKSAHPPGESRWDKIGDARRRRAAWFGLLAAATHLDSEHVGEKQFAVKEIRRCAKVLLEMGVEPTPEGKA
jgi:hypothetical protein